MPMKLALAFVVVAVFSFLTMAYIKGCRIIEERSPENKVVFHFIMVAVRFIFAVTMVGIFTFLSSNREDTMWFAALVIAAYLAMIIATLLIKH